MNPKIRFIGKYGDYRIGEVISPPASLRKLLLDRKLVEFVAGALVNPGSGPVNITIEEKEKKAKRKWR